MNCRQPPREHHALLSWRRNLKFANSTACCGECTPFMIQQRPYELRQMAVKLYADGLGYRQIARHLGVDHMLGQSPYRSTPGCATAQRNTAAYCRDGRIAHVYRAEKSGATS